METKMQIDRIRGSLVGGAIGDALGYPVEFIPSFKEIQAKYGERGITWLDVQQWWRDGEEPSGKAWISDDTQMTLFTACGLLNAKDKGRAPVPSICEAYLEWYYTQRGMRSKRFAECWIGTLPELNQRRAPGNTCLTALEMILRGKEPHNQSKGCGGVMRIAPIPLYGVAQNRIADVKALDELAADAARLTHQHPLGYIPAALLAHVIYGLAADEYPTRDNLTGIVRDGLRVMEELFPIHREEVQQMQLWAEKAIALSENGVSDVQNIEEGLGGGWVAEETLAIALYAVLAHFGDFEAALTAAVNHGGDSDSTGAVAGNILGAAVGYEALPGHYKERLELLDVILHVADDLYRGQTTLFVSSCSRG